MWGIKFSSPVLLKAKVCREYLGYMCKYMCILLPVFTYILCWLYIYVDIFTFYLYVSVRLFVLAHCVAALDLL